MLLTPSLHRTSPLCVAALCGPFMGQGACYAPLLGPRWWMSSLWACGNKLNPSIYLHMARPLHLHQPRGHSEHLPLPGCTWVELGGKWGAAMGGAPGALKRLLDNADVSVLPPNPTPSSPPLLPCHRPSAFVFLSRREEAKRKRRVCQAGCRIKAQSRTWLSALFDPYLRS